MVNSLISNYLSSRFLLFVLSLVLIMISMSSVLGFSRDSFELYLLENSNESFFKTPHTSIRFILFSAGFFLLIYSFSKSLVKDSYPNSFMRIIGVYSILLFFLLNLTTSNGLNYISIILTITSIVYIILYKGNISLNLNEKLLVSSSLIIFYFFISSAAYHDSDLREVDNYTRFLFIIPLYLFLRDIQIKPTLIFNIINISSVLIGAFAIYLSILEQQNRVFGFNSTATIYSNISMLHFFFSFILLLYAKNNSRSMLLPLFGCFFAITAVILSGSRGPLLAIPLFFLFIILNNKLMLFKIKYIILGFITLSFLIYSSGISHRIVDGYNDLKSQNFNNLSTSWKSTGSIIPRLIIWKGSINMIKDQPYFGVGLDNFNKQLVNQIASKKIPPIRMDPANPSAGFNHGHNQYLDLFAKTGIFGLFIFLLFLFIYFRIFLKALYYEKDIMIFGILGLTTVISYFAFMFTHVVLAHQHSILFMLYTLTIFASIISNRMNFKENK